jgi:hypothetical protein
MALRGPAITGTSVSLYHGAISAPRVLGLVASFSMQPEQLVMRALCRLLVQGIAPLAFRKMVSSFTVDIYN